MEQQYCDELVERFLRYTAVSSQSNAKAGIVPSSEGQRELARLLQKELTDLGLEEVTLNEHALLTAKLPGNILGVPAIGFVAHLDTVDVALSPDIHPQLLHYTGGDICLNTQKDIWLRLSEHPELARYTGQDILFTDGTSVLGADNKAAIANIMTMLSIMQRNNVPHGDIRVAFVPDEEIGLCGSKLMDLDQFKVDFAYTIDCCAVGELVCETFNAASVVFDIEGVTAHPMSAKGVLINPLLIAADIMNCFDRGQTPEYTAGREGYWWFTGAEANDSRCTLRMNIRDFDKAGYEFRKSYVRSVAELMQRRYSRARVNVTVTDVYGNISDSLGSDRTPVDLMYAAASALDIEPNTIAMRGGTDGSVLSARGLVTPNYFTGGLNFHSYAEFLPVPSFCRSLEMTLKILELAVKKAADRGVS